MHALFENEDAQFMPFGESCAVVAVHDVLETEYAPILKAVGVMDCPHRALIELTGADRLDFLHRLTSNDLNAMKPGDVKRTLLLSAKGRILSDLLVAHDHEKTLVDVDVVSAQTVLDELDAMLFGEDVQIVDRRESYHRISLHGPRAIEVLQKFCVSAFDKIEPFSYQEFTLGMIMADTIRRDTCGTSGYHLWTIAEHAMVLWRVLLEAGEHVGIKPTGWLAHNIARIEAGVPLFMVDYGTDTLPGETGLLDETVSFTKGCYRGQEVVARMRDIGHPAKVLVRFSAEGEGLPIAGTAVSVEPGGVVVGAVTSSTPSPMRGGKPIGIAMVKWDFREAGTKLSVPTDEGHVTIEIEDLRR